MRKIISILLIWLYSLSGASFALGQQPTSGDLCPIQGMSKIESNIKYSCIQNGIRLEWDLGTIVSNKKKIPKSGLTCPKVGISTSYQSKNFICIKQGKRLIWDKGLTAPADMNPALAATWEKAMVEVQKAKHFGKVPNINVYAEEGVPAFYVNEIRSGVKETLERFGAWNTEQKPYFIIFALTPEYADAKVEDVKKILGSNRSNEDFHGPYWPKMWDPNDLHFKERINWSSNTTVDGHSVQIFQAWKDQTKKKDTRAMAIHEAWHPLADMYAAPGSVPGACWWVEGTATFVSMALASPQPSVNSYLQNGFMGSTLGEQVLKSKQIEGNSIYRTTNWATETCDGLDGYHHGSVVSATLIAEYGWQKFLEFMKMPTRETKWWEHFEKIYGISVEKFYEKSDLMLTYYKPRMS